MSKKIVLLMLALVFLVPFVLGCKKQPPYDPDNFIADTSNPQIVKEKITIDMFVPKHALHGSWNDMYLWQEMERITNIHINFEETPANNYMDKRSLKWNDTKNPTDAFFINNTFADIILSKDQIHDLTDLIDEYAPNYKALMEKHSKIAEVTTLDDGRIYTFAYVNETGGYASKQFINQSWINRLNEDYPAMNYRVPETVEELKILLQAFKNMNPNYVPFSMISGDGSRNMIMNAFGIVGSGIELNRTTNRIQYSPSTEAYRNYLKYMNELYVTGLIDSNIFSATEGDLGVLGKSGNLGLFASAAPFLVVGREKDAQYTTIGPLTSNSNATKMWYSYQEDITPGAIIIPKSSPYQREIVRWMDNFYTEYFAQLLSYGKEGVHWEWTDETKTTFDWSIPEGMELAQYMATINYIPGIGASPFITDFNTKITDEFERKAHENAQVYKPYLVTWLPQMNYTLNEMKEIAILEADLNSYMPNAEANFIKGNKNPNSDTDWNAHLNSISAMKYTQLVELYQSVYDRHINK